MSPPKTCAVCGDKALGYNFNAVTCESCKAFFRRNALAKKQFTCPFNQNCDITVVTRRFCQKCRLKKCLDIGMNSENIMSEEDKMIKRRKIETNRAKRKHVKTIKSNDVVQEEIAPADSSSWGDIDSQQSSASYDSNSNNIIINNNTNNDNNNSNTESNCNSSIKSPIGSCGTTTSQTIHELSGNEIVELIVNDPDRASQTISNLMRNKDDTLIALEKVILNSQVDDALRLISHLIAYPGDALKIISKLMNSPFNALSVFTKFMSSPTDGLEIISKIVSSPQDVLQFIRNLMDTPENALDIMNKFMNTPAEALKMLNRILSNTQTYTTTHNLAVSAATSSDTPTTTLSPSDNILINKMLTTTSPRKNLSVDETNTSIIHNNPEKEKEDNESNNYVPTSRNNPTITSSIDSIASNDNHLSTTEFENSSIDMQQLIQQIFSDSCGDGFRYLNSIDSVLSEVIRLEFLCDNPTVSTDLQIKQEFSINNNGMSTIDSSSNNGCHIYNDNNNIINPNHQNSETQATSQQNTFANDNYINAQKNVYVSPNGPTISPDRNLNEVEQMKLRELKKACEALYDPIDEEISMLDMGDGRIKPQEMHHKFVSLINLTAVAIKRLIKMAKKISAFRNMCQEDQVALLKGGCTEMMIMRSVMTYDGNRNIWKVPHATEGISNIRADLLKIAKCNLYEELLKFNITFDEKWRLDENIILLLCAIVLFTPTRSRIVHKDVIKLEQNSYYYLLRRYLESVYAGCEAKSTLMKLIQKVSDVGRLNQVIIGVYLNVNPTEVEPLIREIFDIKPQVQQY